MTDPDGATGTSGGNEVSDNAFSGPTGAQSGNNNTQINHYSTPAPLPRRARHRRQTALIVIAVVLSIGAATLAVLTVAASPDTRAQGTGGSRPSATTPSEKSQATPPGEPSATASGESPSGPPKAVKSDEPRGVPPAEQEPVPLAVPQLSGQIARLDSSKCVDVDANKDADGSVVQLWECDSDHATQGQQWTLESDGTLRAFGRCLDVVGTPEEFAKVQLWHCTGASDQQWTYTSNKELRNTDLCLDDPNGITDNGKFLWLYRCLGGGIDTQQWNFV